MLNISYFEIVSIDHDDTMIEAVIKIDPGHAIFQGHFPGQPVLPGACMVQMLKEVLQNTLRIHTRLIKADSVKFLTVINPAVNNVLRLKVNYAVNEPNLKINAVLLPDENPCFKFKGLFSIL